LQDGVRWGKAKSLGFPASLPSVATLYFTGGLCYSFCILVFVYAEAQHYKDTPPLKKKAIQEDVDCLKTSTLCRQQRQAVHQQALMFRVRTN